MGQYENAVSALHPAGDGEATEFANLLGHLLATPAMDVHMNTSNTPALRLEQNNSGGFSAQTWDIAGN